MTKYFFLWGRISRFLHTHYIHTYVCTYTLSKYVIASLGKTLIWRKNTWNQLFTQCSVWKNAIKCDHDFCAKINIFSFKSTISPYLVTSLVKTMIWQKNSWSQLFTHTYSNFFSKSFDLTEKWLNCCKKCWTENFSTKALVVK